MKKVFSITVKGNNRLYAFEFVGDESSWQTWVDDGLDVCMVMNTIPMWAVRIGITKIWCFFQSLFRGGL